MLLVIFRRARKDKSYGGKYGGGRPDGGMIMVVENISLLPRATASLQSVGSSKGLLVQPSVSVSSGADIAHSYQ